MNYWHMQLHPGDMNEVNRNEVLKIIQEKGVIGLGEQWDNDRGQPYKFSNDMKIGDIVLVRSDGPVALVKVVSDCIDNEDKSVWFELKRDIKIISLEGEKYKNAFKNKFNSSWNEAMYLPTTIESANSSRFISYWYNSIKKKEEMENIKNILSYKRQIILQGPPGTGKTRLAKIIAEEITQATEIANPVQLIDNFFKTTDTKSTGFMVRRNQYLELLNNFQLKYPLDNIATITKEEYALGTGSNDSFCWWIERGLKWLGYYFPGSARSYRLYWKKEINDYSKHGFVKYIEDNDAAMLKISEQLTIGIRDENYKEASKFLAPSYLLKILHSYYPNKYFPINSVSCLENVLKLFNVDYTRMSPFEKNLKVQEIYDQKKAEFNSDITNIEFMWFLFDAYDLKGNIEMNLNNLVQKGDFKIILFHPSYSYEDFVRGISAKTNSDNKVYYRVEDRILMEFAKKAFDNSKSKYVLILDEINRANLSSVLGELIYALEYRYNHLKNNLKEASVESLYDISEDDNDESDRVLLLPDNLYIIGTMNTADRSVDHIDYAIRRRFAFVDVLPTNQAIDDVVKDVVLNKKAKDLYGKVAELFNEDSNKSIYLQSDFKAKDVQLGHSYFLVETDKQLELKLEFEIKPLLNEYVKDGILSEEAIKEIELLVI